MKGEMINIFLLVDLAQTIEGTQHETVQSK